MTAEDRDFRERFAALRREEEAAAPAIGQLLARTRRMPEVRRVGRSVAAAAAVAVLVVLALLPVWDPERPSAAPPVENWRSPTEFLLRTPGREVLETLPRFGEGLITPDSDERRSSS